jgi:hypothetical protein
MSIWFGLKTGCDTTQGSSNHVSIVAVHNCEHECYKSLHSTEVVYIPHES